MAVTRRQFLKHTGLGLAAATGGPRVAQALRSGGAKSRADRFAEADMKYTTCAICAGGCGVRAFVRDGVLVKLEGNPACQSSGGKLCGKGQAGVGFLYDPDRLKYPLKRTNPSKGIGVDPGWVRIGWDEALDLVSQKLDRARRAHGPQSALYVGKRRANDLMAAIGSPNVVTHNSTCNVTSIIGHRRSFGSTGSFPDLERCRYLLSFGWDMPGKGKVVHTRRFAEFIEGEGTKAVCFDPMLSYTAAKAHEWIPVRPGGDLPVALAMINVIIREGLFDEEYVERYTSGFDEVRSAVSEYTPEWASRESDVPAETIVRIAREFATSGPATIPVYKRHYCVRRGNFSLVQATNVLIAITGNFEVAGGTLLSRSLRLGSTAPEEPPPPLPSGIARLDGADDPAFDRALLGFGMQQTLVDAILEGEPYDVQWCMVNAQSLFSFGDVRRAAAAFSKIPFLVNVNVLPDEMATLADVVLPESTYLESSAIVTASAQLRAEIKVRQPVVEPVHDTRSFGVIKNEIARRLGLSKHMSPIGERAFDAMLSPLGLTFAQLKEIGVYSEADAFEPRDKARLSTPTGRIELVWESMKQHDYPPVPHFREDYGRRPSEEYPFYVVTTRSPLYRHNTTANIEWIAEAEPENGLVMNETKAGTMGIRDGDWVRVVSPVGALKLRAKLTEGIRPDTVCVAHGFGQWSSFLRTAHGRGGNTGEILPSFDMETMRAERDPSGNAADNEIFVRVERA